ncbi:MAG: proline iminopeptidase-family hydrolase [Kiloniellales bacterium]
MSEERQPDEETRVEIDGYEVVTYSYGTGDEVVFLLNGGPGLPCDYLRDPHIVLADRGYRVVTYDQLGCGRSDKPKDKSLWTISRYVEEVETLRKALDLGKLHLLGHSWGGWLSIEYGITYPENLQTVILENTCGDMPHLITELEHHRAALGPETVAMMQRHEAEGTFEHPEYQAAITLLNHRHVCRLTDWPASVHRSLDDWNMDVYGTMQGPNEFLYIGNLKDWNRIADMHRITAPALITVGQHDELTPACAHRMQLALPDARLKVFPNSSHMPFHEEPEAYFEVLMGFLDEHRAG